MEKTENRGGGCKQTKSTSDLFLRWGNKKRLRCVRGDDLSEPSVAVSGRRRVRRKINSHFVTFRYDNDSREPNVSLPSTRLTSETLEEIFLHFQKLGAMVENMVNDHLGLPSNFLNEFNDDRSKDVLMCWRYPHVAAYDPNEVGREAHQDTNCFTFLLQDDAGGLEYEKDGSWIPIPPMEGSLVVNVGSTIQALTNKKMVAPYHRVWKPKGRNRDSFAFFYNIGGEKWIQPLPKFAEEIGEAPKYKGFFYQELLQARLQKERNPLTLREQVLDLDHFAISVDESNC